MENNRKKFNQKKRRRLIEESTKQRNFLSFFLFHKFTWNGIENETKIFSLVIIYYENLQLFLKHITSQNLVVLVIVC